MTDKIVLNSETTMTRNISEKFSKNQL